MKKLRVVVTDEEGAVLDSAEMEVVPETVSTPLYLRRTAEAEVRDSEDFATLYRSRN